MPRKRIPKTGDLVEIIWSDIKEVHGWTDPEEKHDPFPMKSCGYLGKSDDDTVVIFGDEEIGGDLRGRKQVFPREIVKSITVK